MKQLAILTMVFLFSACLASVSWGQHYHSGGGYRHSGFYRGGGARTTVVVGIGNGLAQPGWGYGYRPYYPPARVAYYGGFGYPAYRGYYRPIYSAPGCGYGGYPGGGFYYRW